MDYMEKYMSTGAKEVLIKAAAKALPTYIMSVFRIQAGLCKEMTSIIRDFGWGTENWNGRRKTPWVAWDFWRLGL
jgi:hypothetical protein